MIIHIGYELECDLCHARMDGSKHRKQDLLKEAKSYGWTEKFCPNCKRVPAPDKLRKLLAQGLTIEQIADQYYPFEDWLKRNPNGIRGLYEMEIYSTFREALRRLDQS